MQHDESAVRLEPSRDGPFDIAVVEHVDDFVHDHDPLHRRVGPEGGHDRILPVALMLLAYRDDPVEPGASSLRQADRADVGDRAGDGLEDYGFSRHPHEQEMLVEATDDDVEYGVLALRDALDDQHGFLPDAVVRADLIDDGALVVRLSGQTALEDIVRLRRDRDPVPRAHRVDGPAEARLGEGGRDPAFVDAE